VTGSQLAVVVDADVEELRKTEVTLKDAGFVVTAVDSFAEAKALLQSISPEIVVVDVQLKAFNGLQLAVLFAGQRPRTPFIVTHAVHDPVLETDARRLGAVYVVKTEDRTELKGLASAVFDQRSNESDRVRRWLRKAAPLDAHATVAESDAALVDVSYGGVRLKLPQRPPGSEQRDADGLDVVFPNLELSLRASSIWSARDLADDRWFWGVDLSMNEHSKIERWKAFVDSVL